MPTTPGKYFTELTFTIDIPDDREINKDELERVAELLHRPDPNLTLDEDDTVYVTDITDGGKVVAYCVKIAGIKSFEHDEERIQKLEEFMMELVEKFGKYAHKDFPVQAYLQLHRDYVSDTAEGEPIECFVLS